MKATLEDDPPAAINWPLRRRLMMVAIGYVPFLLIAVVITSVILIGRRWGMGRGIGCGFLLLYLLPPLLHWIAAIIFPPEPGRHPVASARFLRWWLSAQWQVIFNRLPILEELLRLVPGLYSAWLRLWGAKVGTLVYWSPGVAVLDRAFIRIGDHVVFGAGARLNPHVIIPGKGREAQLWLGLITLGDNALIGGYCLITGGSTIPAGASLPAGKYTRPFSTWQDNERAHGLAEGDTN